MTNHTPGPWVALRSERFDNYQIYGAGPTGMRPWICNTKCESVPVQHEANANLIAAAPELLEALRAVEQARISDEKKDWLRATTLTNAAFAKAEGWGKS